MMRYTGRKGWQCGFDDAWNLDGTLAPIILAGLLKFKEMKRHGVSSKFLFDLAEQGVIGQPDENSCFSDEDLEKGSIEWEKTLDKMIFAFDENNDVDKKEFDFEIDIVEGEKLENGTISSDIQVSNEAEWARYREESKTYKERQQEGFELFGRYYSCLWD